MSASPLRVGLVGTGRWARMAHAALLTGGPETELSGVWGRRPEAAAELADEHGVPAYAEFDELVEASEAVAFAVPPDVQAALAPRAARAGRHLLLDKPLALDLGAAEELVEAVTSAGVASMVLLTSRFAAGTRAFLSEAARVTPIGGRAWFLAGVLRTTAAEESPWRHREGALFDVGPHAIDIIDAACGPVVPGSVRAHGSSTGWLGLLLEHAGGAVSEVSMSLATTAPGGIGAEVYSATEMVSLTAGRPRDEFADTLGTARREFVAAAAGAGHPCDAAHALRLQRLIAEAAHALERL